MDIFTHIMMGSMLSSPFYAEYPLESTLFVFGSMLPDVDANSRIFGKRAYMAFHQTYSHAIPLWLVLGVVGVALLWFGGQQMFIGCLIAMVAGAALHVLLDLTNTYGVTWLAPFEPRRQSLEWVFFIDAVVIGATLLGLGAQVWLHHYSAAGASMWLWAAYVGFVVGYWTLKAWLRHRARRFSPPQTVSLLPSALVPWHYLGHTHEESKVRTFRVDAFSGVVSDEQTEPIYDADWIPHLEALPEYAVMRSLSPGFHVVDVEESEGVSVLTCRDLRTRNFNTSFGKLTVRVEDESCEVEKFEV